jgi:hypothetical protein
MAGTAAATPILACAVLPSFMMNSMRPKSSSYFVYIFLLLMDIKKQVIKTVD